ncbi:MAG: hypothetical protein ACLFNU_06415 [Bacteroidales bacterium]
MMKILNGLNNRWFVIYITILLLLLSPEVQSQNTRKSNWLDSKKAHIGRWRTGIGANVGEPTGLHLQLYKLSGICTRAINIRKKLSLDLNVSQEGLIFSEVIKEKNPNWDNGGFRFGIDFKIYLPVPLNPYLGVGTELGKRSINSNSGFYPDMVGRFGIEQKLLGIKISTQSLFHMGFFIEGKYNYCLTEDYTMLLPSGGLRFHFL